MGWSARASAACDASGTSALRGGLGARLTSAANSSAASARLSAETSDIAGIIGAPFRSFGGFAVEHGRARDEHIGARADHLCGSFRIHAAIDLEHDIAL